jgi:PTH1 family peptidyl-tRNA hydrolase
MAYVIIGLGNPGPEYAKTRHNAGRMALELLAKEDGFEDFKLKKLAHASVSVGTIAGEKVTLVIPEVSMNLSGKAAPAFVKSVKAAKNLLVVRDDLDLPLGTLKMTVHGRGSGGHKGVESIMRALKTKEFAQLKIGISGQTLKGKTKKPNGEEKVVKHVIGKFSPAEEPVLKKSLKASAQSIRTFVEGGIEKAMLQTNTH